MTNLPRLDWPNRKVWLGGGGEGLTTQASLGGAAAGKPLGACSKQPVNLGDLQEAGSLPTEVSQHSACEERNAAAAPGACAKAPPPGRPPAVVSQMHEQRLYTPH